MKNVVSVHARNAVIDRRGALRPADNLNPSPQAFL